MASTTRLLSAFAFAALLPGAAVAETVGLASWYGGHHDGRRTSSGETFDQEGFTAASRSIPLGTRIRVTMQDTGQSVVVTVNDRMGGHAAIIDLSKGAAREIGLLGRGRGLVSIASAGDQPIEVAEATEEETADITEAAPARRRRAGRRSARTAAAARPCCRGASVILARHTVQHRAAQRHL